jgi:hypothetical protein
MKSIWTRWASVALAFSAALLGVSDAQAERIVLLQFSGRKASVLQDKVAESLERAGHTVTRSKASSRSSSKTIKRIGKKAEADVVVGGVVERAREGDWKLALTVNEPKKGKRLGDKLRFESEWLPGLTKDLTDNVSRRVEAVMAGEEDSPVAPKLTPSQPEPDPVAETAGVETKSLAVSDQPDLTEAPEDGADGSSGSSSEDGVSDSGTDEASTGADGDGMLIKLTARGGFVRRNMSFSDDIYERLRKQGTNIWVYQAQGELYPFDGAIGKRLGLILSYEGKISGSVQDVQANVSFPVEFSEFFGGVRAKHPLGRHEIGFDLTFGQMNSGLTDSNGAARIPDLKYTLLRAALDGKLGLGPVNATGSMGFRLPLGYGEASEGGWFPRIGGYGFEASLGAEYPMSKLVSLEMIGSVRRYLLEMNSEPQDAMEGQAEVAGGAVDAYFSAYFGVSFTL